MSEVREIVWRDSSCMEGWNDRRDVLREAKVKDITSVGYVLQDTDDAVTLVQSCEDDGDVLSEALTIPQFAIVESRTISAGR